MNGYKEEGKAFFLKQIDYCNRILEMDRVIGTQWRNYYDLAATYAFLGEREKAIENLRLYRKYLMGDRWGVMYFKNDPLLNPIRQEPEFQEIARAVETAYLTEHERVRKWLEENELL
jgi:tetratricopeptide (TPR) repeat protein